MNSLRRKFAETGEALEQRRFKEADVEFMRYLRPLGTRGLHLVIPEGSKRAIRVSGPKSTFRPGNVVPVGSNTGTEGRTILQANAPPGRRGSDFPVPGVVEQPILIPKTPDLIFGGSLKIWYDLRLQGTSEGDGNEVTSLEDFSGESNDGTPVGSKPVLDVSGPGNLPIWRGGIISHAAVFSDGFPNKFSAYYVASFASGADLDIENNGFEWVDSGATLHFQPSGETNPGSVSTLTYPAGTLHGVGLTRETTSPASVVFQKGGAEETILPIGSAVSWDPNLFSGDDGIDFRMMVVSDLPANEVQRAEMATYMQFMISGNWGL